MKNPGKTDVEMSFWGHLDELRSVLLKCIIAITVCAVICFIAKDSLFSILLAPCHSEFISYELLSQLNPFMDDRNALFATDFSLINTALSGQFQVHLESSLIFGLAIALPFCLWQILKYLIPALYEDERRFAIVIFPLSYLMFIMGLLLSYFLLFPIALHFLGNYQVSSLVKNQITITSYIDNFVTLSVSMGIAFELPIVVWLLRKMGFIDVTQLCKYRKHVLVFLLIIAAVITPPDIFTLIIVTIPLYLLYECCIWVLRLT